MKDTLRADLAPLVGQRIALRRKKREWSVADLAERVAAARQQIYLIEKGQILPSWQLAYRIANAFDIEVDDLLPTRRELALD